MAQMTRLIIAALVLSIAQVAKAQLGRPSADDVAQAIARGYKAKKCDIVTARAKPFGRATGFDITVLGPLNRVECNAASAAKKYLPYTADSVSASDLVETVTILAEPLKPELMSDGWRITPAATHLIVRAAAKDDAPALQPDSIVPVPAEWNNAVGGKFQGTGVLARFKSTSFPPSELQIVVITSEREYKTKISRDDIKRIH
jgi:hypothetical protein